MVPRFGWDLENRRQCHVLKHKFSVQCVALSPDGTRIVTGGGRMQKDAEMKLWDAVTGQELITFQGHNAAVRDVAFSPDGKKIISVSLDRTVKVWYAP